MGLNRYERMWRVIAGLLATAVLWTAGSPPCDGEPLPEAGPSNVSRETVTRLRALLAAEAYEEAHALLEAAYAQTPSPMLMFNIAMCEKALSRHVDAVHSFHEYLDLQRRSGSANPEMTAAALAALEELYPLVGQLEIVDAPPGARVTVNGRLVGTTPLDGPLYVLPGRHTVTVTASGGESLAIDVTVAGGARLPVRADISKAPARIRVQCDDADAQVRIDGEVVGGCPYEAEIPEGAYELVITAPDKKPVMQTVVLEPRLTNLITVDLQPIIRYAQPSHTPAPPRQGAGRPLFQTGTTAGALGLIGLGTGLAFSIAGEVQARNARDTKERLDPAADSYKNSGAEADYDEYSALFERYTDEYDNARRYRRAATIGLAVGGGLLLAGAGLVTYYLLNKDGGPDDISFGPTGFGVSF